MIAIVLAIGALLATSGATGTLLAQPHADSGAVVTTDRFAFHSDAWINLHHFLYQWTRQDLNLSSGRRRIDVRERSSLATLSEEQRRVWERSRAFYREHIASKGHFDDDMIRLKEQLRDLSGDATRPPDVIPGIAAALGDALPIYRAVWWPQHDKTNRAWIDAVVTRVRANEARYFETMKRVHAAEPGSRRWRVDVSAYANFAGGYTTIDGHVVIYSGDPGNQDLYALEMVFHELQHAQAIGGATFRDLPRAFETAGVRVPPNLFHALIFATAGEIMRSVAASEGRPAPDPYWIREGFGSFDGWSGLPPVVNEQWLPVVRGERTRAEGLAALARAFRPQ